MQTSSLETQAMTGLRELRSEVCSIVDGLSRELIDLSEKIHDNVEVAFHEVKACSWITDLLESEGMLVERGLGSLPTAFRATAGSGRPRVAFLCEYDGLPPYGQSSGHNIVAAASAGAAMALAAIVSATGGTVIALGTPGEEGGGGKNILLRQGYFDEIDVAMLIYPGNYNVADSRVLGAASVRVEYHGQAAHAAARPELGRNALDAMLLAFSSVNALREQLPSDVRIHGIIDKGGTLPQVIPDHTVARIMVRANCNRTIEAVIPRIDSCLEGAALMTGTRVERVWADRLDWAKPLLGNRALAVAFAENLAGLGRDVRPRDELAGAWSGDIGAVSWLIPTIQPQIAMTVSDIAPHSHEFHDASIRPAANHCLLDAAKAMAMTGVDLVTRPQLMADVYAEFERSRRLDEQQDARQGEGS